jgi:hypothetical protein
LLPVLPIRERKKQKASELEHTVAALTTQLEAMRGVRTENVELQDKNLALVGQLRAREEELERLLREQVRVRVSRIFPKQCLNRRAALHAHKEHQHSVLPATAHCSIMWA